MLRTLQAQIQLMKLTAIVRSIHAILRMETTMNMYLVKMITIYLSDGAIMHFCACAILSGSHFEYNLAEV